MSKDPKIIRVGDKIKVVIPEFFTRCGYPMTLQDGREYIEKELRQKIEEFVNQTGIVSFPILLQADTESDLLVDSIVTAFAYAYVKKMAFGGKERKIYTLASPYYRNKIFKVDGVRFVKTGIYTPGRAVFDYWGWNEYCQPFLSEEKTHKILQLAVGEIECKNVEKIYDTIK